MEHKNENIDEILKKIEASAEEIKVPDSLAPENIKKKLEAEKENFSGKSSSVRHFPVRRFAGAAAAVAVVAAVGASIYGYGRIEKGDFANQSGAANVTAKEETETAEQIAAAEEKLKRVGGYHLAEDYDEVYAAVAYADHTDPGTDRYYINESIEKQESAIEDSANTTGEAESAKDDFSGTNTQVAGVDESDFVKNDGNYLYIQTSEKVSIIDIRGKKMKTVVSIKPDLGASDEIVDMYVDENQLYIVVQKRDTKLSGDGKYHSAMGYIIEDVLKIDSNETTELFTYDITGRAGGKLVGTVSMDGGYQDSRKVGDYIYLFTNRYIGGYTKEQQSDIIPEINNEKVAADCIYVQDDAVNTFVMASINVQKPTETADEMVLMNTNSQVYMGLDSICLYGEAYENDASYTEITRFSYKEGVLNAVAAASVKGTIQDKFAISEADGVLRVLTTEWKMDGSENQLYLLDENLKLMGALRGIASGEEIYAARYIGDIAYFITYHNTDPLFAVDISNPENPKMLGQLEVTGFSDYLHPYGENLLLGIGYETDPDTSRTLGVKLTMFDISNPTELTVVDSVVLDGDYCAAATDYKCALVDVDKNLIGFEVTNWEAESKMRYMVYSWEDGRFVKQMSENVYEENYHDETKIRGLYAGSRFYIVNGLGSSYCVRSYDMDADFEKIDEIQKGK